MLNGILQWRVVCRQGHLFDESVLTLGSEGATRWNPGAFPSPLRKGNNFFTSMNDPGPNSVRQLKLAKPRGRRRKSSCGNTYIHGKTKVE